MFLQPRKIKYKKLRKGKLGRLNFKSNTLEFGTVGLKATESGTISAKQIEAARQAINRKIKRKGKVWLRIYPNIPITSKPLEVRMGKGKGNVDYWAARVRAGTVLFELCGIDINIVRLAFRTGGAKLPVQTKLFT
jgi:large subunit ribosomal protein L16